jgi:hypothetical protein
VARHVSGAARAKCNMCAHGELDACSVALQEFLLQFAEIRFLGRRQAAR